MPIDKVYGVICTADLASAKEWYTSLFGRAPDLTPMAEVHEWYYGDAAGVQLLDDAARAGQSRLTLIVDDLEGARAGLGARGLALGKASGSDFATVAQIEDRDGNVITFAQPGPAASRV